MRGNGCVLGTVGLVVIGVCLQGIAVSAPHQEMQKTTPCAWTSASARLENAFLSAKESRSWSRVRAPVSAWSPGAAEIRFCLLLPAAHKVGRSKRMRETARLVSVCRQVSVFRPWLPTNLCELISHSISGRGRQAGSCGVDWEGIEGRGDRPHPLSPPSQRQQQPRSHGTTGANSLN